MLGLFVVCLITLPQKAGQDFGPCRSRRCCRVGNGGSKSTLSMAARPAGSTKLAEQQQLQPLPLTELARRLCHLFAKGTGRSQAAQN